MLGNSFLGVTLWVLGLASAILMLRFGASAADRERRQERGPASLILAHRAMGYAALLIYLALAVQMAPRPWAGRMGWSALAMIHLGGGLACGILLAAKMGLARTAPAWRVTTMRRLGILLFIGLTILVGSSAPSGMAAMSGRGPLVP